MIDKESLLAAWHYDQPYQAEKDYIQEMALSGIFNYMGSIVFKGGTALSKFYGSPRFSDDLDFSVVPGTIIGRLAKEVDRVVGSLNDEYSTRVMRKKNAKDMLVWELSIRGPLFGMLNKYQHLKIEIDKNSSVRETLGKVRRNPVYKDLRPYLALVMNEKEILAEKVVALLFRHNIKARDLYDLSFLLGKRVYVDAGLIDEKMREHGHMFSSERFHSRVDMLTKIWDRELKRLLPKDKFIGYKTAKATVVEGFTEAGMV